MKIKNKPLVSIIVPVYNDEEYIGRALDSCLAQTLHNIEILCVDDASTDDTVKVINKYAQSDSRVRLIQQSKNMSAFQARRVGIEAAQSEYIQFLDGDDELMSQAVETTYRLAKKRDADIVGEGVNIIGREGGSFEKSLQPIKRDLYGIDILANLMPPGKKAQGALWRFLFARELLLQVYEDVPKSKSIYRVNDLPVTFMALSYAKHYTYTPKRMYHYHVLDGGSSHSNIDIEKFKFYILGVDSVEYISKLLHKDDYRKDDFDVIKRCYESCLLSIIAITARYAVYNVRPELRSKAWGLLIKRSTPELLIQALAVFLPDALAAFRDTIRDLSPKSAKLSKKSRVLIYINNVLKTGGAESVVMSQAISMADAGYKVMLVALLDKGRTVEVPRNIDYISLDGDDAVDEIKLFTSVIKRFKPNVVIDHSILYNKRWPFFAEISKLHGSQTIGWLHNFALRPVIDMNGRARFLQTHLASLDKIVTLSPTDVAYWKLLGYQNVYYLPNPPSATYIESMKRKNKVKEAPGGTVQLLWYGRLQQKTKRVYSLLDIVRELKKITTDFKLTIIGPESYDITYADLLQEINDRGLGEYIDVAGEKRGKQLHRMIDQSHILLSTSLVEGSPLTLIEAQSFGLPIVMYEFPWLVNGKDNGGIISVTQNDAQAAAWNIATIASDTKLYRKMSKASIVASSRVLSYDFNTLYGQLLEGTLPSEFTPEPSHDDVRLLFEWYNFYATDNAKNIKQAKQHIARLEKQVERLLAIKNSISTKVGEKIAYPVRYIKIKARRK